MPFSVAPQNLRDDETIIKIIQPVLTVRAPLLLINIGLIVLAFFLLYPLWQYKNIGWSVFIGLIGVGILGLLRVFYLSARTALVITDRRIIDYNQPGILSKEVTEVLFEQIADISYNKKGLRANLFNYGTLVILTGAERVSIEVAGVRHPEKVQNLLTDIIAK